jgi:hypothetical protein
MKQHSVCQKMTFHYFIYAIKKSILIFTYVQNASITFINKYILHPKIKIDKKEKLPFLS